MFQLVRCCLEYTALSLLHVINDIRFEMVMMTWPYLPTFARSKRYDFRVREIK